MPFPVPPSHPTQSSHYQQDRRAGALSGRQNARNFRHKSHTRMFSGLLPPTRWSPWPTPRTAGQAQNPGPVDVLALKALPPPFCDRFLPDFFPRNRLNLWDNTHFTAYPRHSFTFFYKYKSPWLAHTFFLFNAIDRGKPCLSGPALLLIDSFPVRNRS